MTQLLPLASSRAPAAAESRIAGFLGCAAGASFMAARRELLLNLLPAREGPSEELEEGVTAGQAVALVQVND